MGNWPTCYHQKKIVYHAELDQKATSLIPELGQFHVSLNSSEGNPERTANPKAHAKQTTAKMAKSTAKQKYRGPNESPFHRKRENKQPNKQPNPENTTGKTTEQQNTAIGTTEQHGKPQPLKSQPTTQPTE